MTPREQIEDLIRNARTTTDAATDRRIAAAVEAAKARSTEERPAFVRTGGAIRRIIMNSKWTKLATAATILIAVALGMYALTGSMDATSITLAHVRQAMQEIDWVQMIGWAEEEKVTSWYSFASKVAIHVDGKGRIVYLDFNADRRLVWNPGSREIYEYPIDEGMQFAGGVSNIFEGLTKTFDSVEAEGEYRVTKELGTYKDQKVEIWTARRIEGKPGPTRTELFTIYIDVDKKLPIASTDIKKGADGDIRHNVEFEYPETGPADIYEAGAPGSAQIIEDSQ